MKQHEIPKFLLDRNYMMFTVLFIAMFTAVFLLIYSPFSQTMWLGFSHPSQGLFTAGFFIVAVALMLVSKQIMYWAQSRIVFSPARYVLWLVAELLVISLFYNFFTAVWVRSNGGEFVDTVWLRSFLCVTAILALPYAIATLYAAYRSKAEELELERHNNALRNRSEGDNSKVSLVNMCDSNGNFRLSLDVDSLYYVESQDNYVKIYYQSEGKMHNYMLRCSTKTLESSFAGTSLVRCHRSYIVNLNKIKMLKNERNTTCVELKHVGIRPIPISKSYYESFMKAFSAMQQPTTGTSQQLSQPQLQS